MRDRRVTLPSYHPITGEWPRQARSVASSGTPTMAGEPLAVEHGDGRVAHGLLPPRPAALVAPRAGSGCDAIRRTGHAGAWHAACYPYPYPYP